MTDVQGLSRRGFLSRSAVVGAGVLLAGSVDGLLSAPNGLAQPGPPAAGSRQPGLI